MQPSCATFFRQTGGLPPGSNLEARYIGRVQVTGSSKHDFKKCFQAVTYSCDAFLLGG
jgi:hypothetical protein